MEKRIESRLLNPESELETESEPEPEPEPDLVLKPLKSVIFSIISFNLES